MLLMFNKLDIDKFQVLPILGCSRGVSPWSSSILKNKLGISYLISIIVVPIFLWIRFWAMGKVNT